MGMAVLSIVLPSYNEEQNISNTANVLAELLGTAPAAGEMAVFLAVAENIQRRHHFSEGVSIAPAVGELLKTSCVAAESVGHGEHGEIQIAFVRTQGKLPDQFFLVIGQKKLLGILHLNQIIICHSDS